MSTSIVFGANRDIVSGTWTDIKEIVASKGLPLQFTEDPGAYTIFGLDGSLAYVCTIWTGTVPDGVIASGYSQSQNDTDKADFENNYQANANRPIGGVFAFVPGYTQTTNGTRKNIVATAYNQPSSNAQRSMSSSSADDTSAGTGARTVRIIYYDQTLAGPFTETVTLNGTTAVNTVATNICFIERMEVVTVGSGGNNAGTITLHVSTGGGGGTVGTIAVNDNQTNWCHHYVALGRTAYLLALNCSVKGMSSGNLTVLKTAPATANSPDFVIAPQLRIPAGGNGDEDFGVPIPVKGPARIVLQIQQSASTGTNDWFAGFGYKEV